MRHGAVSYLLPPNSQRCSCLLNFTPACSSLLALKVNAEMERFFPHFSFVVCGFLSVLVGMRQRAIDPAPAWAAARNKARRAGEQGETITKGEGSG